MYRFLRQREGIFAKFLVGFIASRNLSNPISEPKKKETENHASSSFHTLAPPLAPLFPRESRVPAGDAHAHHHALRHPEPDCVDRNRHRRVARPRAHADLFPAGMLPPLPFILVLVLAEEAEFGGGATEQQLQRHLSLHQPRLIDHNPRLLHRRYPHRSSINHH